MDVAKETIARLESAETFGYHADSPSATEPVALSAIALISADRHARAATLLHWLVEHQAEDGSLGVNAEQTTPCWPTSWAIVAWALARSTPVADLKFAKAGQRAVNWLTSVQGELIERTGATGHDTMIPGWPWVRGTHAWAEPTAIALLALRHAGLEDHPRTRQAAALLRDRLLPNGGMNYGNTIVFGQELRPHVQPTGLCMLALPAESLPNDRIHKALAYLAKRLPQTQATASLCYGLLGTAAWNRLPNDSQSWLEVACRRTLDRDPAPYKLALLSLAGRGTACPLLVASRTMVTP